MTRALLLATPLLSLILAACAQSNLTQSGALASYDGLQQGDGVFTKAKFRTDRPSVMQAKTVAILPADLSESARGRGLTGEQLSRIANKIDRSLCAGLSERFKIARRGEAADLKVQAFVTIIEPTNVTAAGVSSALGIGGTVASAATGLPLRVPRLPVGLGALSVEAQALDKKNRQVAAMIWSRGADVITTRARASEEGDAYALADEFGADFARLMVTGDDPIKPSTAALPSMQNMREFLGGQPKETACERYGANPGLAGVVGGILGAPPKWTDTAPKH